MNKEAYLEHKKLPPTHSFLRLVCAAVLVGLLATGYKLKESSITHMVKAGTALAHDPDKFFVVDDSEALQGLPERRREKIAESLSVVGNLIPSQETLETRIAGDLKLTKLWGNWSDQQMGILVMPDRFKAEEDGEFLKAARGAIEQILSAEPVASNREKFGAYALSVKSTPPFSCFTPYILCDDSRVTDMIDRVTYAFRLPMVTTIVIVDSQASIGKAYMEGSVPKHSIWSYLVVTKGATNPEYNSGLAIVLHEWIHLFTGDVVDEYQFPFPRWDAADDWANCTSNPERKWASIPNNPGRSYPGCHNTTNGFGDSPVGTDLMGLGSNNLGPVDRYRIKERIELGLNGYYLLPLPELPHKQYLPSILINRHL